MKKAIVIGATSGIGRELAKLLAGSNYKVGITGRRSELLSELEKENPTNFIAKKFDVTATDTVPQKLQELADALGGLDLLIMSSGTGDPNEHLDFEIEKRTIETNILGFTCIMDWTFDYFNNKGQGHLVAISSIAGLRGGRLAPAYNATKAYQINYLEALRQKAHSLRVPITVTDIRPGFVDTDMAKGEGKFWVAPVMKASQQIFDAIQRKKKVAYVSKRWAAIATVLKLLPSALHRRM